MNEHTTPNPPAGWFAHIAKTPLRPNIIPVIPPDAPLSPSSAIKKGGKAPGCRGTDGLWRGIKGWETAPTLTDAEIAEHDISGASLGIRGGIGGVVGIDLDITDIAVRDAMMAHIGRVLGALPLVRDVSRTGHVKALLACRVTDPFGQPMTVNSGDMVFLLPDGVTINKIQLLAAGRQFVAVGRHVDGGEYRWDVDLAVVSLPEVAEADLETLWRELPAVLVAAGCSLAAGKLEWAKKSHPVTQKEEREWAAQIDMDVVKAAVTYDELPEALRTRFEASERLRDLWTSGKSTGDMTGSGHVMTLAVIMELQGFTITEFAQVSSVWPLAVSTDANKDADANVSPRSLARKWAAAAKSRAERAEKEKQQFGALEVGSKDVAAPYDFWSPSILPDLPTGLLPKSIESFAISMAMTTGADAAGFAMAALVVCAAVTTDKIKLQVLQNSTDWLEEARIWVGLIGDPSVKKTPIIKAATKPIFDIDLALVRKYTALKQLHDATPKKERSSDPPPQRRVMLNDTTAEAAQEILKGSPDGVLLAQDELSGFFSSMERYSPGGKGDRSFWLRSYGGGPYPVNRISRGSFVIPNLSVSILGGVQPDIMRQIAGNTADDGLIQRITPVNLKRGGATRDVGPSPEAASYGSLVHRLHQRHPRTDPFDKVEHLKLDAQGMDIRSNLEEEHLALSEAQEQANARKLSAAIIKQDGLFARLCIVWHVIETIDEPGLPATISGDVAHRVATFMRSFLRPHLFGFYETTLGASDDQDRLTAVAGHILAHRLDIVANREAQAGIKSLRKITSKDLTLLFEQLESLGWVVREMPSRTNASPRWKVEPGVHSVFAARAEEERQRRQDLVEMLREMRSE